MAWKKADRNPDDAADPNARLITSDADKVKSRKWFDRARELGEKRQFDYAIEYYVNGLEYWPDAVDEACRPLHGCGVARLQTGGKKPSLKDTMKRSLNDKDPKQAFLNAVWLFGHDPDNLSYSEGVTRNAGRLRAEDTAQWAGGVFLRALEGMPKAPVKQIQSLVRLVEELGDRAAERNEASFAISAFQTGVEGLTLWRRRSPKDQSIDDAIRNLSTKLTILKGKYKDGESYRESLVDIEAQAELHDKDRSVQSDERLDQLIAVAEEAYRQNPDDARCVKNCVDMLCRRERDDEEVRAIGVLVTEYKRTDDYRWKQLADDIRMKQLGRRARELAGAEDREAYKKHQVTQLRFELNVFKERVARYPTDNRIKFELGVRCFRAGRYDDAIPLFQSARADPRNRAACGLYLGRCFFRKGYHSQGIATLEEAFAGYEFPDDETGKDLQYWLARSHEAGGAVEEARKTYGRILQFDYNYRDVRVRLDALPSGDQPDSAT